MSSWLGFHRTSAIKKWCGLKSLIIGFLSCLYPVHSLSLYPLQQNLTHRESNFFFFFFHRLSSLHNTQVACHQKNVIVIRVWCVPTVRAWGVVVVVVVALLARDIGVWWVVTVLDTMKYWCQSSSAEFMYFLFLFSYFYFFFFYFFFFFFSSPKHTSRVLIMIYVNVATVPPLSMRCINLLSRGEC